ncbi:MAG: sulfurtransferase [Rhodobacteraceae bacterium]|nr:MAG: sulfurtransferase [Paracoccaceae bacterium]
MQKLFKLFQVMAVMIFAGTAANAEIVKMTPDVAREKALAGEIVLIDIRRPEEWAGTGVPDVALLVDMTSRDFLAKINAIRMQNPDIPLAFTCRTGSRSNYLTGELEKLGMSGLIDVIGGMSGSRADKGWAKRGLPIRAVNDPVNPMITVTQP